MHRKGPRRERKLLPKNVISEVRHTSASMSSLMRLAEETPTARLIEIWAWTFPRYHLHKHLSSIRPRTPSQLSQAITTHGYSKPAYLRTMIAQTHLKAEDIKAYLALARESASKIGNQREAITRITEFCERSMWSYSLISQALHALSQTEGLDAQRTWMKRHAYTKTASLSNLIVYGKGIICEGGRHPHDVLDVLDRQIFSHLKGSDILPLVYYLILAPSIDYEKCDALLPFMISQSVVDQYELLASLASSTNWNELPEVEEIRSDIERLMLEVGDWRAEGIKRFVAEDSENLSVPADVWTYEQLPRVTDLSSLRAAEIRYANSFFPKPNSTESYLLESIYTARTSDSIKDISAAMRRRRLAIESCLKEISVNVRSSNEPVPTEEFGQAEASRALEALERYRLACLREIQESRFSEALQMLYDFDGSADLAAAYFPSEVLFSRVDEDLVYAISDNPKIAVCLVRLAESHGDVAYDLAFIAAERYMTERGVLKPSDLVLESKDDETFLAEACQPQCLRKSLEFLSKSEMENERILILAKLIELEAGDQNAHIIELHGIIEQQAIEEILQKFQIGKIQCDEIALAQWARAEIEPRFSRLRDFITAGMLPVERNADIQFVTHLASGSRNPFTFKVPSSESLEMARSIISDMIHKYSMDPRYGIDSYLSLGMRHGAVEAHLRSPLSVENLITSKGVSGYEASFYWQNVYLQHGRPELGEVLSEELKVFSEKYDSCLDEIKNELMQVRRNDKPDGLIVADWSEASVLSFSARFAEVRDFDQFVDEFSSVFLSNIDSALEAGRAKILEDLSSRILALVDELEAKVLARIKLQRLAPFSDAVARAKQELSVAIREVAMWHRVARSTDLEPLSIVEIIRAAEKISRRLYPDFEPRVQFLGDVNYMLQSSLHALIEVFRALFTNVYEHSGILAPSINIVIDTTVHDALRIEFASDCADLDTAELAAAEANERIASGEYEKKLSKEGGSGLAKVARATLRSGSPNLSVFVDREERRFVVDMSFVIIELGTRV